MAVLRWLLPMTAVVVLPLCCSCSRATPAAGGAKAKGSAAPAKAPASSATKKDEPAAKPAVTVPATAGKGGATALQPGAVPAAPPADKPATWNPEPGTRNSEPGTRTPEPAAAPPTALSVEESILIALRNNIDLRRSRLADRQAELDRSTALAQFLPSLSASVTRSHDDVVDGPDTTADTVSGSVTQRTPIGTTVTGRVSQSRDATSGSGDRDYSSSASAEVRQPLLAGAGTAAALYDFRAADLGRSASASDLARTAQSTAFQVRRLYWSAVQDELSLAANRRSLESADYFLKAAKAREEAGQASKLDVSNAEIQRSSREVALTLAEARREQGLDSLKQALDLPLEERLALSSAARAASVSVDRERTLSLALERRPDLVAARERLDVVRLDVERKRRNAWPSLDLVAGYTASGSGDDSRASQTAEEHNVRVGVELSVPLGLVSSRNARQKAELDLRRGELDLHRREIEVQAEVRRVLRDLTASERNMASYEKRLEAAKLAAAAAKALYERGRASSFDVVRSEDDLLSAELGLAGSQADYLSRLAELDLVSGRPVSELLPGSTLPTVKSELKREAPAGR